MDSQFAFIAGSIISILTIIAQHKFATKNKHLNLSVVQDSFKKEKQSLERKIKELENSNKKLQNDNVNKFDQCTKQILNQSTDNSIFHELTYYKHKKPRFISVEGKDVVIEIKLHDYIEMTKKVGVSCKKTKSLKKIKEMEGKIVKAGEKCFLINHFGKTYQVAGRDYLYLYAFNIPEQHSV